MASETEAHEPSSLVERWINSRNRDLAMFLPFILALTNSPNSANPLEDSLSPVQETGEIQQSSREARDRIILINPLTQGMVVIEGSSSSPSLDFLFRDLFNKDGQPPASKESIEAMPIIEISQDGEECVICLEEWVAGGVVKEMPCKHRFHGDCIEKWLRIHGSCPVCRHKMPVEENDEKSKTSGEHSGRRREVWVSFSFANSSSDRRGEESNQTDSVDSSSSPSSRIDHNV